MVAAFGVGVARTVRAETTGRTAARPRIATTARLRVPKIRMLIFPPATKFLQAEQRLGGSRHESESTTEYHSVRAEATTSVPVRTQSQAALRFTRTRCGGIRAQGDRRDPAPAPEPRPHRQ